MTRPKQTDPPADKRSWTILDLLTRTSDYLTSRNIPQARSDAEILLAHALGMRRIDLYVQYDKPLRADELGRYREAVRRRARREPVAYITGEKEFWSLPLHVTTSVLIPRPDTECLVETALAALAALPPDRPHDVLDMGTGSGAVVLALASERPTDRFLATDRSWQALGVARGNAVRHGLDHRIRFVCGSWCAMLKPDRARFDLIVSNPPYIPAGEIPALAPEIRGYEPVGALDGGIDGTESLWDIVASAANFLRPGGGLLLEMGHDQRALVEEMVARSGQYTALSFVRDFAGHERVARMRRR